MCFEHLLKLFFRLLVVSHLGLLRDLPGGVRLEVGFDLISVLVQEYEKGVHRLFRKDLMGVLYFLGDASNGLGGLLLSCGSCLGQLNFFYFD